MLSDLHRELAVRGAELSFQRFTAKCATCYRPKDCKNTLRALNSEWQWLSWSRIEFLARRYGHLHHLWVSKHR